MNRFPVKQKEKMDLEGWEKVNRCIKKALGKGHRLDEVQIFEVKAADGRAAGMPLHRTTRKHQEITAIWRNAGENDTK